MHLDDVSGGEPLGDGAHVLELIVDRLRVRGDVRERIAQSLETALERGGGRAVVFDLDGEGENGAVWERRFSSKMLVRSAISRLANWSRATFPGLVGAEPARIAAVQD